MNPKEESVRYRVRIREHRFLAWFEIVTPIADCRVAALLMYVPHIF
jgi:hypothetical protein